MRISAALLLMAVGGILADAITVSIPGFDLNAAGAVLFFVGLFGLLLTVWLDLFAWRRERAPRRFERVDERRRPAATEPRYDPVLPPHRRQPRDPGTAPTRQVQR